MFIRQSLVALVLASLAASSAEAKEITGAFGIPFGEPLSDAVEVLGVPYETWAQGWDDKWNHHIVNVPGLHVSPPIRNPDLPDYHVVISPTSRIPFIIGGSLRSDDIKRCGMLEDAFIAKISELYPDANKSYDKGVSVFYAGSKKVSVDCKIMNRFDGSSYGWFNLNYRDDEAEQQAVKEQLAIDAEEVTADDL